MLKKVFTKLVSIVCALVMVAGMTACNVNVETSNNIGKSAIEYNSEYMVDNFEIEELVAEIIATKLDEKDFGKIKSYKKKIINGNGSMTFSDGKKKYTINVEDGYISTVTDADGMVIMTLDDILEEANNPQPGTTQDTTTVDQQDPAQQEPAQQEPDVTETPSDTTNDTVSSSAGNQASATNSYLSAESQSILNGLDTDYSKVNWGVQYSPTGMDGVVISIAPYTSSNLSFLLVGVTNLYDQDITFSAKAIAKGTSGQEVGNGSFYELAIRPGNTIVKTIYCSDIPTGEIHWDYIELPKVYDKSVYWESDWTIQTDKDGFFEVPYRIVSEENMVPGSVTAVILDASGNILAVEDDYNIEEGTDLSGTISFYTKDLGGTPADLAMFSNPLSPR